MSDQSSQPVGQCPNCGVVSGDDLEYLFPSPCECNRCGEQLKKTTFATEEEIAKHA